MCGNSSVFRTPNSHFFQPHVHVARSGCILASCTASTSVTVAAGTCSSSPSPSLSYWANSASAEDAPYVTDAPACYGTGVACTETAALGAVTNSAGVLVAAEPRLDAARQKHLQLKHLQRTSLPAPVAPD